MTNYCIQDSGKGLPIGKLVCLARTYTAHAKEMKSAVPKEPLLFLKPESSVVFNGDSIRFPSLSNCLHHEVELGVVIGKHCKHVKKKDALEYVFGYLVGLDITARDIQSIAKKNGWPWSIAKGFDTFAPISDVVLKEKVKDPNKLDLCLKINGEIRQQVNTNQLVFSVEKIIEFISDVMTLKEGDLILTGTPEGVGEIFDGDMLEASLGNFCTLNVDVVK